MESKRVIVAGVVARFQFRLCHCRLKCYVPQPGSLGLVGLAAAEIAQKCRLCHLLCFCADCLIMLRPVNGKTETAPQILKLFFVFFGELLAQFDEIAP